MIFFVLFYATLLYPSSIDISQDNISLLEKSEIYLDEENLTLADIIANEYFTPYNETSINIGSEKKTVWVKLIFKNTSSTHIEKIILIYSLFLENITFYSKDNLPLYGGQGYISSRQKTVYDYYPISLEENTTKTVYLKCSSTYVSLRFLLSLEVEETYLSQDYTEQMIDVFLIGFIFALMLYSLILSVYIKDKSYFFYATYLFIVLYDQSRFVGLSHLFFSESLMLFDFKITIVRIYLLVITSAFFTIHFLKIQKYKNIYRGYILLISISFLSIVLLNHTEGLSMNLAFILLLIICIYNLITGFYMYGQGKKQARLYILGFGIVFVAYILIILDISGVIAMTQHYQNILLWTTATEALVLSLAFADRYMLLQKEKETISLQYLKEAQSRENIIEKEVQRKTTQLNSALEGKELLLNEVHHRVKNNLHIILSMIQLQHSSPKVNTDTLLQDLENRINAIAKTYDMLIMNEDLEEIDMKPYVETLLHDIQESFFCDNCEITVICKIEAILSLQKAVYVGLIINEAVTNSYKYAFNSNRGNINVVLTENEGKYTLYIKDDGIGFNSSYKTTSMGMKLIETLVNDQLHGTLSLSNKGKTEYTICF